MDKGKWALLGADMRTDKMIRDLRDISYKAELARVVDDQQRRRQLLQEICFIAAEYVTNK